MLHELHPPIDSRLSLSGYSARASLTRGGMWATPAEHMYSTAAAYGATANTSAYDVMQDCHSDQKREYTHTPKTNDNAPIPSE